MGGGGDGLGRRRGSRQHCASRLSERWAELRFPDGVGGKQEAVVEELPRLWCVSWSLQFGDCDWPAWRSTSPSQFIYNTSMYNLPSCSRQMLSKSGWSHGIRTSFKLQIISFRRVDSCAIHKASDTTDRLMLAIAYQVKVHAYLIDSSTTPKWRATQILKE